jgi:hypothetical protein
LRSLLPLRACSLPRRGGVKPKKITMQTKSFAIIISFLFIHSINSNIPYTLARNYFVRNDFKGETFHPLKITTNAQLTSTFGMAAFQGPRGKVTLIDFSKQYALAIIGDPSDHIKDIVATSLKKKGNTIVLSYKLIDGEKSMSISRPMLLIIVDKKYVGDIRLAKE